jgi:hypothetical protein
MPPVAGTNTFGTDSLDETSVATGIPEGYHRLLLDFCVWGGMGGPEYDRHKTSVSGSLIACSLQREMKATLKRLYFTQGSNCVVACTLTTLWNTNKQYKRMSVNCQLQMKKIIVIRKSEENVKITHSTPASPFWNFGSVVC